MMDDVFDTYEEAKSFGGDDCFVLTTTLSREVGDSPSVKYVAAKSINGDFFQIKRNKDQDGSLWMDHESWWVVADDYDLGGEKGKTVPHKKSSSDILKQCLGIQEERGADYDTQGEQQERSFQAVSTAFNAVTGKDITPAEVCLMLQILKDVRQWSQPDRLHEDSVLDGVSYASLKAEELHKQLG